MLKRLISSFVCFCFIFTNFQYVHAQDFNINQLPTPGSMVTPSEAFSPLSLKGLVINPQKPLEFQFIVDTGSDASKSPLGTSSQGVIASEAKQSLKEEANKLVKYFLAGLTIPEGELWVNLSPYEKNRITTQSLGQTELGRDLLAQDYILKQLTASLIYPEKDLGKKFWSRVYTKAQQQFGTTNVPVNTFNKVWILPDQAQVFENGPAAYVTKSTLKVMLDEDYLALQKRTVILSAAKDLKASYDTTHVLGSQIIRQIILPEIEKEVNTGKNFAPLRQIYDAMILAKWYKETFENGILDTLYTNKNKTAGVNLTDPAVKEQIYQRYIQAYKKGVFNYVKEDPTPEGQSTPRKYFSGGITKIQPDYIDRYGDASMISLRGIWVALTVTLSALIPVTQISAQENRNPANTANTYNFQYWSYELTQNNYPRAHINLAANELVKMKNKAVVPVLIRALQLHNFGYDIAPIAKALGELKDTSAVPALIEALNDFSNDSVIQALGEIGDKTAVPALIEQLVKGRPKAAIALAQIGDARAVPYLIDQLKIEYSDISKFSAEALGRIGDTRAIPALKNLIKPQNGYVGIYAAKALIELGDKDILRELLEQLRNNNDESRKEYVIYILGYLKIKAAVPALIKILKSDEFTLPQSATEALGDIGDNSAVPALLNAFKNGNGPAAIALGKIGDSRALQPLINIVKANTGMQQYYALQGLGLMKDNSVLPLILSFMDDPSLRANVIEILGKMGDKRAIPALIKALADKDTMISTRALSALSKIGDKTAVIPIQNSGIKAFYGMADDPIQRIFNRLSSSDIDDIFSGLDSSNKNLAIERLLEIGDEQAERILVSKANDNDTNTRSNIANALGRFNDNMSVNCLINITHDSDPYVDDSARTTLRVLVTISTGDDLIRLFNSYTDQYFRQIIIQRLGELKYKPAVGILINALNLPDPKAKSAAVAASEIASVLIEMESTEAIPAYIHILINNNALSEKAENVLTKIGKPAVPLLILALESEKNSEQSKKIIRILINIGDPQAVEPIRKHLDIYPDSGESWDKPQRTDIKDELAKMGASRWNRQSDNERKWLIGEFIASALAIIATGGISLKIYLNRTRDARLEKRAKRLIKNRLIPKKDLVGIVSFLKDKSPEVRKSAIEALRTFSRKDAVEYLLNMLSDPDIKIREFVVAELNKRQASQGEFQNGYITALSADNSAAKFNALENLAAIKNERSFRAILPVLSDESSYESSYVASAAIKSLEALSGIIPNKIFMYAQAINSPHDSVRLWGVTGLGTLRSESAIPLLMKSLNDKNGDVSYQAALTLSKWGHNLREVRLRLETRKRLIAARPSAGNHSLLNFETEAYLWALEGFNFKVIHEPEETEWRESSYQYEPGEYVITKDERLYIEKGQPLTDLAMAIGLTEAHVPYNAKPTIFQSTPPPNLDKALTKLSLEEGRIDLNKINDPKLYAFLQYLQQHNLGSIVVFGGAVRDIFFHKRIKDLDITVSVPMTDEERRKASIVGSQASRPVLTQADTSLNQLAAALGVSVEQFFDKNDYPQFQGIQLHYLGPHRIPAQGKYQEIIPQGTLADSLTRGVFSSLTSPGILQMAIDSQGNLYGFQNPLADALAGIVRFQGDLVNGRNLNPLIVAKWFRLKFEFGFNLLPEDYRLISRVLQHNFTRLITQRLDQTLAEMHSLLDQSKEPSVVLKEMENVGLTKITGFKPAGNSSMIARSIFQTILLNILQYRNPINPKDKIDDIVVLGNAQLNVFRQALRIWRDHQNSRIVTSGGVGRLTQQLINNAISEGFTVTDRSSEAVMIREIMFQMIDKEDEFKDLKEHLPQIEIEPNSRNTPENIQYYKKMINSILLTRTPDNPYRIVYLQTSHQQLRAKATLSKYFENELQNGKLVALSDTAEYKWEKKSDTDILDDIFNEAIRLIAYSKYGNNSIAEITIPDDFWNKIIGLYDSLETETKHSIAEKLSAVLASTGPISPDLPQEQAKFLDKIIKDSAMLPTPTNGGIDLNKIVIHRTGHIIKMQFDPAQLDRLEQGGFEGFTPIIINMTRISSPLPLLGIAQQKEYEMLAKL